MLSDNYNRSSAIERRGSFRSVREKENGKFPHFRSCRSEKLTFSLPNWIVQKGDEENLCHLDNRIRAAAEKKNEKLPVDFNYVNWNKSEWERERKELLRIVKTLKKRNNKKHTKKKRRKCSLLSFVYTHNNSEIKLLHCVRGMELYNFEEGNNKTERAKKWVKTYKVKWLLTLNNWKKQKSLSWPKNLLLKKFNFVCEPSSDPPEIFSPPLLLLHFHLLAFIFSRSRHEASGGRIKF